MVPVWSPGLIGGCQDGVPPLILSLPVDLMALGAVLGGPGAEQPLELAGSHRQRGTPHENR
jgi:hypothetical protein